MLASAGFGRIDTFQNPLSDAAGVEGEVLGIGDVGRARGGGTDHGRIIGAKLRRWDDERGSGLRASFFEGVAQEGVGGDAACYDDGRHVVEIYGPKELAGEGLDDGGLVARGQVRQLFAESLSRP